MIYRIIYEIDLANAPSPLIRPIVRETQDARVESLLSCCHRQQVCEFLGTHFSIFPLATILATRVHR